MACSKDPNCTAFRYNPITKLGFLCEGFDPKPTSKIVAYEEDEWKICEFDSGKRMSDITMMIKYINRIKPFLSLIYILLYICRLQKQWKI